MKNIGVRMRSVDWSYVYEKLKDTIVQWNWKKIREMHSRSLDFIQVWYNFVKSQIFDLRSHTDLLG